MNMYNIFTNSISEELNTADYTIDGDTYIISNSAAGDNAINLTTFPSLIRCNKELEIGNTQEFRVDSLIFLDYFGMNKTELYYSADQTITISGNDYNTMVFTGNTTDFVECA